MPSSVLFLLIVSELIKATKWSKYPKWFGFIISIDFNTSIFVVTHPKSIPLLSKIDVLFIWCVTAFGSTFLWHEDLLNRQKTRGILNDSCCHCICHLTAWQFICVFWCAKFKNLFEFRYVNFVCKLFWFSN